MHHDREVLVGQREALRADRGGVDGHQLGGERGRDDGQCDRLVATAQERGVVAAPPGENRAAGPVLLHRHSRGARRLRFPQLQGQVRPGDRGSHRLQHGAGPRHGPATPHGPGRGGRDLHADQRSGRHVEHGRTVAARRYGGVVAASRQAGAGGQALRRQDRPGRVGGAGIGRATHHHDPAVRSGFVVEERKGVGPGAVRAGVEPHHQHPHGEAGSGAGGHPENLGPGPALETGRPERQPDRAACAHHLVDGDRDLCRGDRDLGRHERGAAQPAARTDVLLDVEAPDRRRRRQHASCVGGQAHLPRPGDGARTGAHRRATTAERSARPANRPPRRPRPRGPRRRHQPLSHRPPRGRRRLAGALRHLAQPVRPAGGQPRVRRPARRGPPRPGPDPPPVRRWGTPRSSPPVHGGRTTAADPTVPGPRPALLTRRVRHVIPVPTHRGAGRPAHASPSRRVPS